jgi:hypothetical protein
MILKCSKLEMEHLEHLERLEHCLVLPRPEIS